MNSRRLAVFSDCLVLLGVICLGLGWNGNAGVTGAFPFHSSTVQLSGSAAGAYALLGVPSLLMGLILMTVSLVWMAFEGATGSARRG